MKGLSIYLIVMVMLVCAACSQKSTELPAKYDVAVTTPGIYPDYTDVVDRKSVV